MFYSDQDFKDGCTFNFWYGVGAGSVGSIGFLMLLMWVLNII